MSGKNTEKYQKLVSVTGKLTDIVADGTNVVGLSQELFEKGLISKSNNREMTNAHVSTVIRAAQLIGMVLTKVELNEKNFDTFVEILKEDETTYGTIVAILCKIFNNNGLASYI